MALERRFTIGRSGGDEVRKDCTLFLQVAEARHLPAMDVGGTSDPYCVVKVEGHRARTRTIWKTLEPLWGEDFIFELDDAAHSVLSVAVYDQDAHSKDDLIGAVNIPIITLSDHKQKENWFKVRRLDSSDLVEGDIFVSILFSPPQLTVSIIKARNLASKDNNGLSDPYAVVKWGNETQRTKTIMKEVDPMWNESFVFKVASSTASQPPVIIEVWDYDRLSKDDFMGRVTIDLGNIAPGTLISGWFHLEEAAPPTAEEKPGGDLRLRLKLSEEIVLPESCYAGAFSLITKDGFHLVKLLGTVCDEKEDVARILVRLFEARGEAVHLAKVLASEEIDAQKEAGTLFRGNSIATKAIDLYMKHVGKTYLKKTLKPLIDYMYTIKEDLEVDPLKAGKKADVAKNMQALQALVVKVIDAIFASVDHCPVTMRLLFQHLQWKVGDVFPANEVASTVRYTVVAGFIFLRFFNPAILGPKLFDLADDHPTSTTGRILTLVAKAIQNLANLVAFGEKEPYMKPMNAVLEANFDRMKQFLDALSSPFSTAAALDEGDTERIEVRKEMALLCRHLFRHASAFVEAAKKAQKPELVEDVCALLVELNDIKKKLKEHKVKFAELTTRKKSVLN